MHSKYKHLVIPLGILMTKTEVTIYSSVLLKEQGKYMGASCHKMWVSSGGSKAPRVTFDEEINITVQQWQLGSLLCLWWNLCYKFVQQECLVEWCTPHIWRNSCEFMGINYCWVCKRLACWHVFGASIKWGVHISDQIILHTLVF